MPLAGVDDNTFQCEGSYENSLLQFTYDSISAAHGLIQRSRLFFAIQRGRGASCILHNERAFMKRSLRGTSVASGRRMVANVVHASRRVGEKETAAEMAAKVEETAETTLRM